MSVGLVTDVPMIRERKTWTLAAIDHRRRCGGRVGPILAQTIEKRLRTMGGTVVPPETRKAAGVPGRSSSTPK